MKKKQKRIGLFLALTAILLVVTVATAGCLEWPDVSGDAYEVTIQVSDKTVISSAAGILEEIRPTVVDVSSYSDTRSSAGSGVIIGGSGGSAEEGYEQYFIITNHHVIDGGTSFTVDVLSITDDGKEQTTAYDARLVGGSKMRDIAVLSIRPNARLSVATFFEDSDNVKVGSEVFAIGNPLGILGGTVTHGIVSATKRSVNVDGIGMMTLMQTDATINGGNSGGGLFDMSGNLIGIINSGFDSYNGQNVVGLNFAIPANDARLAAKSLIETHTEADGEVTSYGYVTGDAQIDVTVSLATLYTDSTLGARKNYLVASASSTSSLLYEAWNTEVKAIFSLSVNGEKTEFGTDTSSSYALTGLATDALARVKAGDVVVIEYRDVLARSLGTPLFGASYQYLGSELKTVTVTAEQYVYRI